MSSSSSSQTKLNALDAIKNYRVSELQVTRDGLFSFENFIEFL